MNCEYIKCIQREALIRSLNKKCDRGRAGQSRAGQRAVATSEKNTCLLPQNWWPTCHAHTAYTCSKARRSKEEARWGEHRTPISINMRHDSSSIRQARSVAATRLKRFGVRQSGVEARLAHDMGWLSQSVIWRMCESDATISKEATTNARRTLHTNQLIK